MIGSRRQELGGPLRNKNNLEGTRLDLGCSIEFCMQLLKCCVQEPGKCTQIGP